MNEKFMTSEQFDVVYKAIIETHERLADELGGELDPMVNDKVCETLQRFVKEPYARRDELHSKGIDAAERFLERQGYELVEREWSCRFGSIELVAKDDDDTLCFITVKTVDGIESGFPDDEATREKKDRFEKIALCYMMEHEDWNDNDPVRFDTIAICVTGEHKALLRHHKNCNNM